MNRSSLILVLFAAIGTIAGAAEQINFRSTPASTNYTSAGAPSTLDEGFVFELGAFASGFTPSSANTADWATNWTPLGRAKYNAVTRWFTDSALLESNSAPFQVGGAAYLWGHNSLGEWILLTNPGWTWPFVSGGIGTPGGTTFSVSNIGTITVLGAVNGAGFQMMTAAATGDIPDVVAEQWLAQYFSNAELEDESISGPLADPDGDGVSNLEELAAGTNPEDSASWKLADVAPFLDPGGDTFIRVRLERDGRALIGHTLAISQDLQTWDRSGVEVTVIENSPTLLILQTNTPVGSEEREFYRFELSIPTP